MRRLYALLVACVAATLFALGASSTMTSGDHVLALEVAGVLSTSLVPDVAETFRYEPNADISNTEEYWDLRATGAYLRSGVLEVAPTVRGRTEADPGSLTFA